MKNSSFTLIEISIVLVIIATLATLAVPNVSLFVRKSRDAKRISDMQVLILAVESFYDDQGSYPGPGHDVNLSIEGECIGTRGQPTAVGTSCEDDHADQAFDFLIKKYIHGPVPHDPLYGNDGEHYYYAYDPHHLVDWPKSVNFTSGNCDDVVPSPLHFTVLGLRRFETNSIERHRDTCDGTEMELNNASYNIAFSEMGLP